MILSQKCNILYSSIANYVLEGNNFDNKLSKSTVGELLPE